ncbi:MAG: long-chain fatty acid--CoA ligase [Verrucomicrobiota bacterium]|jgi:hypothetical protein
MSTEAFSRLSTRVVEFIGCGAGQPEAATEARFNELALEAFALQCERVPTYHRLCSARGVAPDRVAHWTELPALPTIAFKEFDVTSLAPEERTRVFHSSGTTVGQPGRHFHDEASLAVYEVALRPWFQAHVLPETLAPGGKRLRLLVLTPPAEGVPNSSLAHMFAVAVREWGTADSAFLAAPGADGAWLLRWAAALAVLREAETAGQPVCLLGTAFSFVHLLDHLEAAGMRLNLPAGSRVLETGGYKGRSREVPKSELHALIKKRLGLPASHILCEYGMSELGSQAYDGVVGAGAMTAVSRVFHFPPWARVCVVSPETGREVGEGETGLLRIVDLANVRSVIAIQTEDLAARRGGGFELVGRVPQTGPRGCSLMVG